MADFASGSESSSQEWPGGPERPDRVGRLAGSLLTLTFVAIAVCALLVFVPLPYVVMHPGPAVNTLGEISGEPIIEVDGARTYPTSGELRFTTVRVVGLPGARVNVYDVTRGALAGDQDVVPRDEVVPRGATEEEVEEVNTEQMVGSQEVAAAVALRALGRQVPGRIEIASVADGSPAAGALQPGDELVSVEGRPATNANAVRAALQTREPGQEVTVVVDRDETRTTVQVPTVERDGKTVLGVVLRLGYDLPVDVTIHSGAVGGPSAGLMFALGTYDLLTPGALTGGKDLAGTGTIDDDGSVGPIGQIAQKLAGARDAGSRFFLAPGKNCGEVVGQVPAGLQVVRVDTFDDALAAVQAIAADEGADLPGCAAG